MWIPLIIALLMNSVVGNLISRKRGQGFNGKIMDIGFDILPDLSKYEWLHDFTLIIPIIFLALNWNNIDQKKYIKFLTIMYFMRAICNIATQYPRAKINACHKSNPLSNCNDYMFSGHTTFNIVTSYFLKNGMFPIYPMISSLITISTREHYTADVIVAWIIFFALKCNI